MIRVFAGCAPNHEDLESQAVFEYTLKKHSSEEIDLHWMKMQKEGIFSGWNSEKWATPFTGFRWAIPELCKYKGKAIYCDSDFIFFDDIAQLWKQPIPAPAVVLAASPRRMCIMVMDCKRMQQFIPPVAAFRHQPDNNIRMRWLFQGNPQLVASFTGKWNCLEGEGVRHLSAPDIQALHYTCVPTQPHLTMARERLAKEGRQHWYRDEILPHPNLELRKTFLDLLDEAIKSGYTLDRYAQDPLYGPVKTTASYSLWIR